MKIEIQKAKFSDLKTLKIISRKASEASHKYYQPNIVSIMHNSKHFLLDFLNPFWHIYTVTLDKKLIAFATVSFYKSWVYHIFVDPEYSNQGIGTYIMNYVEQMFKNKNLKSINLYARLNAVSFYTKLGFEDKGEYVWCNIFTRFKKIPLRNM